MRGVQSLIALAAGLVLATPAGAADQPIGFANYMYSPASPTIKTGDTATFNGSFMDHPLAWDSNAFATTSTGTSKAFSFSQAGDYAFHCTVHQGLGMAGVVHVIPDQHPARVSFAVAPAAPSAGQPVGFAYTGDPDPDGSLVRWEWDLDGNGSFETATPEGSATTSYPAAGTVTVRMRAIDDSNEPSPTASQTVVVAAAGGSGSGAPAGGAPGGRDTAAPRATLLRLRGLKLSFRSSERASATATLRARGKTIARGTAQAKSGAISIRLRLTKAGRSLLPHGRKLRARLTLTLRDAAGNRRTVTRQLTVRRS
jgi:plastocyanin